MDTQPSRGLDDLCPERGSTTGMWIRLSREEVENFFKTEKVNEVFNKTLTPQKLL